MNGIRVGCIKKNTNEHRHHIETYGPLKDFGYKEFVPMFKAENYNPEEWVKLFKRAGAKFIDACR